MQVSTPVTAEVVAMTAEAIAAAPVRTTAEVVLGVLPGVRFERAHDEATGYKELRVSPNDGRLDGCC